MRTLTHYPSHPLLNPRPSPHSHPEPSLLLTPYPLPDALYPGPVSLTVVSLEVEWKTVPYSTVAAFSIQSAGGWDVDSELLLWTDIYPPPDTGDGPPPPGMTYIRQDLRKGKADIFAIQRVLAHKVLGPEARSRKSPEKLGGSPSHSPAAAALGGRSKSSFLDWDNASQLSPADMEASLRGAIPILLDDEHVELAYRARRDSLVLTTHRLMVIDVQGLSGKKVLLPV